MTRIAALLVLPIAAASASSIFFSTPPGATNPLDAQPVSAEAFFQTFQDMILVTLTNRQNNPVSVSQGLNALAFQPSGGSFSPASLTWSSAEVVRIDSNTAPFVSLGIQSTGWLLEDVGDSLQLCLLCVPGPKQHLLLGDSGAASLYSNANASIAGNGLHNPFLRQSATFQIYAPGVTPETTIRNAVFSFGSTTGADVFGDAPGSVPEPATLLLIGAGVLLMVLGGLRRRSRS